ncbi:DUF6090 family protein [uncultured Algibacter sp.]|uniref:DUF6090 family protein n=1 Tax=uncultured Algibacter sp. TaxID=298659 RepID=UPI002607A5CD|nr:DUF6090 family protein [uncultured Algibacter sp.]
MIKFFRNIRKKLLKEGNTTKYFKYAIGEIVLVVIGILIALQINNWNENRIERVEEKQLLTNLKSEMIGNQERLEEMIKFHEHINTLMVEFSTYFGPEQEPIEIEKFESYISSLLWTPYYSPQKGVFNSIISSAKLGLIKKDILSFKISSITSLETAYNSILDHLSTLSSDHFATHIIDKYPLINMRTGELTAHKRSAFPLDQKKILQSVEFETLSNLKRLNTSEAIIQAKELHQAQDEIINLIDVELKRFE